MNIYHYFETEISSILNGLVAAGTLLLILIMLVFPVRHRVIRHMVIWQPMLPWCWPSGQG